jgi:hypothetical protein
MATPSSASFGRGTGINHSRPAILLGFREEILPALILLWGAVLAALLIWPLDFWLPVGVWATVTTIMLWPVGRRLNLAYREYRTVWFVLGVLSMAYILFAGFVMQSDLPFLTKSIIFWGLVVDLTVFAVIPSFGFAIGRPVNMVFRPDLIFGDGRVLCCGIIAMVLGMRYIIGSPPMGAPWPIPKWNWWAIFFAMVVGFLPLIPLRGMMKLRMRLARVREGRWAGWGAILLREALLVVGALAIGYGFHNAFLGTTPFTVPLRIDAPGFDQALAIIGGAALFLIVVRGAYKKAIGDPFIRETVGQTWLKEILLVVGLVPLYYGLMSLLHMDPMHLEAGVGGLRTLENAALIWPIGLPIFLWGLAVLIPFRVLAQIEQRKALARQMAAVVLPHETPAARHRMLVAIMAALAGMPGKPRLVYMREMQSALDASPPEVRRLMIEARMGALAELAPEKRRAILSSMDRMMTAG